MGCSRHLDGLVGVYDIDYPDVYEVLDLRKDGTFKQVVVLKDRADVVESKGHYEHLESIVEFDHFLEVFTPDGYLDENFAREGEQEGLAMETFWGTQCMEYQSERSDGLKYFCRFR